MACPECDQPQVWAGMSWHPHSDQQHTAMRRRLTIYMARLLRERSAVRAGHRITIRFTQTCVWFECSCGAAGNQRIDSAYARGEGHDHLNESATL